MKKNFVKTSEQWNVIYNFLLLCGQASSPEELARKIIDNIGMLCSFDAASAYLMSSSGAVIESYLRNIEEKWIKIYLGYYMNTDDKRYSLNHVSDRHPKNIPYIKCHNWLEEESSEFIPDFIRVRGLTYSCGFGLYDMNQKCRMSIALDRMGDRNFSPEELENLQIALPLLNDMHKNFYHVQFSSRAKRKQENNEALTVRESQITALLCQSASPAEISHTLHIAQSTTYKHIANIYQKLNVSSQRELLSLLLND